MIDLFQFTVAQEIDKSVFGKIVSSPEIVSFFRLRIIDIGTG